MKSIHFMFATVLWIGFSATVNSKPSTSLLPEESTNESIVLDSGAANTVVLSTRYRAFISYRPSASKHLAMLLKVLLQENNIAAYIDVEDPQTKQLKNALLESPNFIIILSKGTLEDCFKDKAYKDVLNQQIRDAVRAKKNIIPIFDDNFEMPANLKPGDFPEINEMLRFQGVAWTHSLVDGTLQRLITYLK